MTRKEAERQTRQLDTLRALGFTRDEAESLRRISMTLRRWFELECGNSNAIASYAIERDEETDVPYMAMYGHNGQRTKYRLPDRENGARRRLAKILKARNIRRNNAIMVENHPTELSAYIQTDPRGCALYIIRPGDVPDGGDVSAYYTRGICVY